MQEGFGAIADIYLNLHLFLQWQLKSICEEFNWQSGDRWTQESQKQDPVWIRHLKSDKERESAFDTLNAPAVVNNK